MTAGTSGTLDAVGTVGAVREGGGIAEGTGGGTRAETPSVFASNFGIVPLSERSSSASYPVTSSSLELSATISMLSSLETLKSSSDCNV